jgi:hypothetical protein
MQTTNVYEDSTIEGNDDGYDIDHKGNKDDEDDADDDKD